MKLHRGHLSLALGVLLTCSVGQAIAQFDAMPDHSAQWVVHVYDGPNLWDEGSAFLSNTPGDTLIDSQPFTKLFSGSILVGALHDNGVGQVHFHSFGDHTTYLLYDFAVSQGDSVEVYNEPYFISPLYVTGVDSVQYAGTWRKRIGISESSSSSIAASYWVQGIGGVEGASWSGGLLSTCGCVTVSLAYRLFCASANDTVQYGPSEGLPGNCFIVQGVGDHEDGSSQFSAYADMLSNDVVLRGIGLQITGAEMVSCDGRTVVHGVPMRDRLAFGDLMSGVYIVRAWVGASYHVTRVLIQR